MEEILIEKYFDTRNYTNNICGKQLSTNAFMDPINAFIKWRSREAVTSEPISTRMEKHLKVHILDLDAKSDRPKSESLHSRTDLARSSLTSDKDEDVKADKYRP